MILLAAKKLSFLFILLFFLFIPNQALSHATLTEASPSADSSWKSPPDQIVLTFNERLEKQFYGITVRNQLGHTVTSNKATLSEDQRQLQLQLPVLQDGLYTVSYQVISADGHPVKQSYIFNVGEVTQNADALTKDAFDLHAGHSGLGHSDHSVQGQIENTVIRIFYYAGLLFLTGWIFWSAILRREPQEVRHLQRNWTRHMIWLLLIVTVGSGLLQFGDLLKGAQMSDVFALFTKTSAGLSWLLSVILTFTGLFLLQRLFWLDIVWAATLLILKSFNGHAMAVEPPVRTIILDSIHLFGSAIWAGGLLYLLMLGLKFPERRSPFIQLFSRAAFLSIIVLAATGTLLTLLLLPQLKYVLYTLWGKLLMAKVALVICVLITASFIRFHIKKNSNHVPRKLILTDFTLMICIVIIVGTFTILSPSPKNDPLHWHVMGDQIHMTANIKPNQPGTNDFEVIVWLPEQMDGPKRVQLLLKNNDDNEMGSIEVPLKQQPLREGMNFFIGFEQYLFSNEGPYLPFPGKWEVEVRVMDANDDEFVFHKQMMIY